MSVTGKPPLCTNCRSLERHRIFRELFLTLQDEDFAGWSALQFSFDRSVEPEWFRNFEISIYGEEDSLDIQKINRATDSYDLVICNHVLEHVPYDNAALYELGRITKPTGFAFLSFPDPMHRSKTSDWGYAIEEQHGHYRVYGSDVVELFRRYVPQYWVLNVQVRDLATASDDIVFFMSKGVEGVDRVREKLPDAAIVNKPGGDF